MFNHLNQMYYGPKHAEQMKNCHFMHNKLNKFVEYYDESNFCLVSIHSQHETHHFIFIFYKYNEKTC
jgi:hypothetical protein